jgi:thiosulfate dehydrogenase [quinone] large subunit
LAPLIDLDPVDTALPNKRFGGSRLWRRRHNKGKAGCFMQDIQTIIGNPSKIESPHWFSWLQTSKIAALGWTAMRVWLGVMWLQAGISKLWGAENPSFMHHNGAGVAGFASHGAAAYSWWGSFLHNFVVPNAGWIGVLVAVGEFAIGIALAIGFLTPVALLASLLLLFTYVMSGTASVCAFYALFAVILLAMWKTAGWIGVDGLITGYRQRSIDTRVDAQMKKVLPIATIAVTLNNGTSEAIAVSTNGEKVSVDPEDTPVPVTT